VQISGKEKLVFSPQGDTVAFRDPGYAYEENDFHNPILLFETVNGGINSRRMFYFPDPGGFLVHPEVTDYAFSEDGTKLLVLFDQYSDYFEKSMALYLYEEDLVSHQVIEEGKLNGSYGSFKPRAAWSPDGKTLHWCWSIPQVKTHIP